MRSTKKDTIRIKLMAISSYLNSETPNCQSSRDLNSCSQGTNVESSLLKLPLKYLYRRQKEAILQQWESDQKFQVRTDTIINSSFDFVKNLKRSSRPGMASIFSAQTNGTFVNVPDKF